MINDIALSTTNEFCSQRVDDVFTSSRPGCTFRSQPTTDDHYYADFNNASDDYRFVNHDGETGGTDNNTNHGFVDEVKAVDECDNTSSCDWHEVVDGDYLGIKLTGTGDGGTAIKWYNFGTSTNADLEDPSTWDGASPSPQTCECDTDDIAAQVPSSFTLIDSAGKCGPESTIQSNTSTNEVDMDTFACGDIP
jgi:hypothetical protein